MIIVRRTFMPVTAVQVPGSKKIDEGNYDPATRQLRLTFQDGTAQEVGL
jgi:hypothetical protein